MHAVFVCCFFCDLTTLFIKKRVLASFEDEKQKVLEYQDNLFKVKINIPLYLQKGKATSFFTKLSRKDKKFPEVTRKLKRSQKTKMQNLKEKAKKINLNQSLNIEDQLMEIQEKQEIPLNNDKQIVVRTFRQIDSSLKKQFNSER